MSPGHLDARGAADECCVHHPTCRRATCWRGGAGAWGSPDASPVSFGLRRALKNPHVHRENPGFHRENDDLYDVCLKIHGFSYGNDCIVRDIMAMARSGVDQTYQTCHEIPKFGGRCIYPQLLYHLFCHEDEGTRVLLHSLLGHRIQWLQIFFCYTP